jgi:methyl-accepting chemotaxis protein
MYPQIPQYVFIIFTAVTSVGVLLQALVLLGMFLGLKQTQKKIIELVAKANEHLIPALSNSRSLLEEISPKIKIITANLVETSGYVRDETRHIHDAVDEVVDRSKAQAARVDEMVSGTLDSVTHATRTLQDGIAAPIRQLHGVLNGVRAGLDVLRGRDHVHPSDPDMFV